MTITRNFLVIALTAVATFILGIGCSANQPPATITVNEGRYTPLGGVEKSDHPAVSDYAGMQAAANGSLGQPAFVEFYADN